MWETGAQFEETLNGFQNDPQPSTFDFLFKEPSSSAERLDEICGGNSLNKTLMGFPLPLDKAATRKFVETS